MEAPNGPIWKKAPAFYLYKIKEIRIYLYFY